MPHGQLLGSQMQEATVVSESGAISHIRSLHMDAGLKPPLMLSSIAVATTRAVTKSKQKGMLPRVLRRLVTSGCHIHAFRCICTAAATIICLPKVGWFTLPSRLRHGRVGMNVLITDVGSVGPCWVPFRRWMPAWLTECQEARLRSIGMPVHKGHKVAKPKDMLEPVGVRSAINLLAAAEEAAAGVLGRQGSQGTFEISQAASFSSCTKDGQRCCAAGTERSPAVARLRAPKAASLLQILASSLSGDTATRTPWVPDVAARQMPKTQLGLPRWRSLPKFKWSADCFFSLVNKTLPTCLRAFVPAANTSVTPSALAAVPPASPQAMSRASARVATDASLRSAANGSSITEGAAAVGAFLTLVAGLTTQEVASLLKTSPMITESALRAVLDTLIREDALNLLTGVRSAGAQVFNAPFAVVEDMLTTLTGIVPLEDALAVVAIVVTLSSVFVVTEAVVASRVNLAAPSSKEYNSLPAEVQAVLVSQQAILHALDSNLQQLWNQGAASVVEQVFAIGREAGQFGSLLIDGNNTKAAERPISMCHDQQVNAPSSAASDGLAVSLRSGSARLEGGAWTLPLDVQVFQRNEGKHVVLLALCRQLLFQTLHGITDFDSKALRLYEERARLIFRSLQPLLANELAFQRLEVRLGGQQDWHPLPPTDTHGIVSTMVRISDGEIALADLLRGQVCVEVRFAEGTHSACLGARSHVMAHLVMKEGLTVISDIDDTVKVTDVFRGPEAVLRNTFLREFEAIDGMAELYRMWAREYGASFQYVSKSPPALHDLLLEFLTREGFPVASLHLCPLWRRDRASFKLRTIEAILAEFPERQVVLVGDSGERDPEVYAEALRRHPNQIAKILIREVHAQHTVDSAVFQGIDPHRWQVFQDPSDVVLPELFGWLFWRFQGPWLSRLPWL